MIQTLVTALREARAAGRSANFGPELLPKDPDTAYAAAMAGLNPRAVAAWKIGGANPWSQHVFANEELFFGALTGNEVALGSPTYNLSGLVAPLAEPEIMLELADWPLCADRPVFARMALGFEIPASALPEAAKPRLCGQILDRAGAGGLWIGAPRPFDGAALERDFEVSFAHSNHTPRSGRAADVFGGPVGSALLFLGQAMRRGMPLQGGQWIASGGLVPAVAVRPGDRLRAEAAPCPVKAAMKNTRNIKERSARMAA